jgi:hypothetical protein
MNMSLDFTSQEYFRNPAAAIARLRESAPVVQIKFPIIGKVWITTTKRVGRAHQRLSLRARQKSWGSNSLTTAS